MRYPSLAELAAQIAGAARRFPLVLVAAVASFAAAWVLSGDTNEEETVLRIFAVCVLGIAFAFAVAMGAERHRIGGAGRLALNGAVAVLLVGLWLAWRHWTDEAGWRRYVQFLLAAHLLAAFLPYLGAGEANGFWQYNRRLLLRFLLAAFYSVVLYAGLAIALLALDKLFGLDVTGRVYSRLWLAVAFVFHPWFFLGGVPRSFAELEADRGYPTPLKVFSRFILIPIVVVYLTILTAYLGKIVVTQVWPSGWIGYLVSCVAAVGLLSLLLVHPIEGLPENRWIRTYARFFYIALVPAIVMLLLAVWKRVDQYGVTENRYFLTVLAFWLAAVAAFFGITRSRRILLIPASLCAVALLTSFGPWGAYATSRRSQAGRLDAVLSAAGMLPGDVAAPPGEPLTLEQRRQLSAVLVYLIDTHGPGSVTKRFPDAAAHVLPGDRPVRSRAPVVARELLDGVGVEFAGGGIRSNRRFYMGSARGDLSVRIDDLTIAVAGVSLPIEVEENGVEQKIHVDDDAGAVILSADGRRVVSLPLERILAEATRLNGQGVLPDSLCMLRGESAGGRLVMRVNSIRGTLSGTTATIDELTGDFYWTLAGADSSVAGGAGE